MVLVSLFQGSVLLSVTLAMFPGLRPCTDRPSSFSFLRSHRLYVTPSPSRRVPPHASISRKARRILETGDEVHCTPRTSVKLVSSWRLVERTCTSETDTTLLSDIPWALLRSSGHSTGDVCPTTVCHPESDRTTVTSSPPTQSKTCKTLRYVGYPQRLPDLLPTILSVSLPPPVASNLGLRDLPTPTGVDPSLPTPFPPPTRTTSSPQTRTETVHSKPHYYGTSCKLVY